MACNNRFRLVGNTRAPDGDIEHLYYTAEFGPGFLDDVELKAEQIDGMGAQHAVFDADDFDACMKSWSRCPSLRRYTPYGDSPPDHGDLEPGFNAGRDRNSVDSVQLVIYCDGGFHWQWDSSYDSVAPCRTDFFFRTDIEAVMKTGDPD